jgi:hypothetical protein
LKTSANGDEANTATEFIEGKGWVDENGNVVETVKEKKIPEPIPRKKKVKKATPPVEESDDDTSSSGTSSSGSSDEESEDEMEVDAQVEEKKEQTDTAKETPQPDDESSDSEADSPEPPQQATPLAAIKADETRPMSSSSSRSLTIKIPPPGTPSTKVHPLEALFKRNKPDEVATETPAKKEAEPFSFFGGIDNDDIEDEEDQDPANLTIATPAPMTPFSRQDFEWRNVRSAAPTPDTAHPSRMRNFWPEDEEDGDEDLDMAEHGFDEDGDEKDVCAPQSSSDFQAWFWDNRRDLNRSWMKRRKTAAKEKRHRENKARANKAA